MADCENGSPTLSGTSNQRTKLSSDVQHKARISIMKATPQTHFYCDPFNMIRCEK